MSRKGDCGDNAGAESFFSMLVWSDVCFANGFPDLPPVQQSHQSSRIA